MKKSGSREEVKGLTVIRAGGAKPISERLQDLEAQLEKTQWLGGQKLSSLDKDAIEELMAGGGIALLSPVTTPNLFAWFSIVSKFSAELRQSWPKMKSATP